MTNPRSTWQRLRHHAQRLLPPRGSRAFAAAFVLLAIAPFLPRLPLPRQVFQSVVVFDITQSMDVPDHQLDGRPASRLAFAREAMRRALPSLPCGSRIGWAVFAEYRTLLLSTPVEVCENHGELLASLARIDGGMRWGNASEVTKALYWAMRAVRDTHSGAQVVFITDGHEAPPLDRKIALFDDLATGAPRGLVVGVGGDAAQPIPRSDRYNKPIGLWKAEEVVQLPGRSDEHLSALHEPHLQTLAREVGFGYARLRSEADAVALLRDERAAKRVSVPTDVRAVPVALALLLLVWSFVPEAALVRLRRRAAGVPLLAALVAAVPAQAQIAGGAADGDAPADASSRAVELAPGAWHLPGRIAPWGPGFAGQVSNSGFVVGSRCIAVIDAGGSPTAARRLLAEVRRTSTLPVCWLIATHVHPDHLMGREAFADANAKAEAAGVAPKLVGHAKLAASLAARLPFYLRTMQRDFAPADRAGGVAPPDVSVADRLELDLGDRVLELRAWPTAHTDADLTVFDRASGTLWLGDLVFAEHLPVLDGKLVGWRRVLDELRTLRAVRAVPGHGAPIADWPAGIEPTAAYLAGLDKDVRAALRGNLSLAQTVEKLGAAAPPGWRLAEEFQRRNVTAAYAELEWAE